MARSVEALAATYDDPYQKAGQFTIDSARFEKALARDDDGSWGVGALVRNEDCGLFVREGDTWLLPGGRLEADETFEAGARREVEEEAGIEINIGGLGSIATQTFVREESDDSYKFQFATFIAEPAGRSYHVRVPEGDSIDAVEWHSSVPQNTFDRALVGRLFDTHV